MRRRIPAAHWGLLTALLLALFVALGLQSISQGVGRARTAAPETGQVDRVKGGGTVLFSAAGGLDSRNLPDRTVALTFDDGPDPKWTAQVLDVLHREGVPATFFVVGARASQHPDLVRRELREGHELGNHTWSHSDLSNAPAWRRNLELSLGQLGLAGSAHVSSALLRPPYSSSPEALDAHQVSVLKKETDAGYVVVLADRDTEDWRRPGLPTILAAGTPVDDKGHIVLMHDAGGDRSETVAALPALIERYREAGYTFTTVSKGLGLLGGANPEVGTARRLQGEFLGQAVRVSSVLVTLIGWVILPLGLLSVLRTLLVVLLARRHVRLSARRVEGPPWSPPVSVLVPAYNEAVGIEQALRSLVASDHPNLEIVVIDDGSTDGTGDIVESLGLPKVRLVRQSNGGKAAALRRGTAEASHEILVMLDGDTVFESNTVRLLVQPLKDPRVGAVSGNTKVGNRRGLLGRWQHLEYVSGFNLDRRLLDLLRCITTVPGACGAFRREAVVAAGGLSSETLAEDTDITMGILRAGYEVVHEERARAWTEAPSRINDLWKQRYRWGYGTLQCVWKHRHAVVEGGPGHRLGVVGLPYMVFFQVLLPLAAPVIDVFALHGLLSGSARTVATIWLAYAGVQVLTAAYALHLDQESLKPLWSLPLQQLFYRQLIYLVVIQSIVSAIAGARLPWHKLHRSGDVAVPA